MHRYTVIYNVLMPTKFGSRWHTLTKVKRIEVENNDKLIEQIIDKVGSPDIQYIFEGWPKMQGE